MAAVPDTDSFYFSDTFLGTGVREVLYAETGIYPDNLGECFNLATPSHFDPHYYDPLHIRLKEQSLLSFRNYNTNVDWLVFKPVVKSLRAPLPVPPIYDWHSGTLLNDDSVSWANCRNAADADGFFSPWTTQSVYGWNFENYYRIEGSNDVTIGFRICRANLRFEYNGPGITQVLYAELNLPLIYERDGAYLWENFHDWENGIFPDIPPPSFTQNILAYKGTCGSLFDTQDFDEFDINYPVFSDARNIYKSYNGMDDELLGTKYKGFMKKVATANQRDIIRSALNSADGLDLMLFLDRDINSVAPDYGNFHYFFINSGVFITVNGSYMYLAGYHPRLMIKIDTV